MQGRKKKTEEEIKLPINWTSIFQSFGVFFLNCRVLASSAVPYVVSWHHFPLFITVTFTVVYQLSLVRYCHIESVVSLSLSLDVCSCVLDRSLRLRYKTKNEQSKPLSMTMNMLFENTKTLNHSTIFLFFYSFASSFSMSLTYRRSVPLVSTTLKMYWRQSEKQQLQGNDLNEKIFYKDFITKITLTITTIIFCCVFSFWELKQLNDTNYCVNCITISVCWVLFF